MKDDDVYNAVIEEALGLVDTDQDGKLTLTEYMADWHAKVCVYMIYNIFVY